MLSEIFKKPKPILGKIQLLALPGAPGWGGQWETLVTRAEQEATALATGGVDSLIIENSHDVPFTAGRMDTAGAIAMAMLARRLKQFTDLPIGISVLRNDPETALAIAMNCNADFIRLSVLAGALMTDSGIVNSRLNELLHYKNHLKTELPPLLVDLSTAHLGSGGRFAREQSLKHLTELALAIPPLHEHLALVLSDRDIAPADLASFKASTRYPVLLENQACPQAVDAYFEQADGLILEVDTRKKSVMHPELPPTIDMARVETVVNRLRRVVPLSEMDPDIFLSR
jgi:membrane complex biogenesis BtpA family protein